MDPLSSKSSPPPKSFTSVPAELRPNIILKEALTRYNLNAVPSWSCLYGTHLMRGEAPETVEDSRRNIEWTSVVGDCWKIPYDSRVILCFRAPMDDITAVVRVRNFLSHFHKAGLANHRKGENFNVWDWFDTGISAYWYPGKGSPTLPVESSGWSSNNMSQPVNSYPLSTMVAPWRRIM